MGTKLLKFVFAVLFLLPLCANAVPITIEISGNITSASGISLPGTIHAGSTFTGTYTYDSLASDSDADSHRGTYQYDAPYGISILVGGYEFKTASNHTNGFEIYIRNDESFDLPVTDYYTVFSDENISTLPAGFTMYNIIWNLRDNTHDALSSDALPTTAPVLADWGYNVLTIYAFDSLGYGISIKGTVAQAVPEPLTSALLAMGAFLLRRKR
jgi:hypothetical protein